MECQNSVLRVRGAETKLAEDVAGTRKFVIYKWWIIVLPHPGVRGQSESNTGRREDSISDIRFAYGQRGGVPDSRLVLVYLT